MKSFSVWLTDYLQAFPEPTKQKGTITMEEIKASEEIRRRNSRAIERRDTWRRRYKLLSNAIRIKRREVRELRSEMAFFGIAQSA
jgi:hypothetical protein